MRAALALALVVGCGQPLRPADISGLWTLWIGSDEMSAAVPVLWFVSREGEINGWAWGSGGQGTVDGQFESNASFLATLRLPDIRPIRIWLTYAHRKGEPYWLEGYVVCGAVGQVYGERYEPEPTRKQPRPINPEEPGEPPYRRPPPALVECR